MMFESYLFNSSNNNGNSIDITVSPNVITLCCVHIVRMACNKCIYASSTPYLWIHFACCIVIIIFLLFRNIRKLYVLPPVHPHHHHRHRRIWYAQDRHNQNRFLLCCHPQKEKLFVHIFFALSFSCALLRVFYDMHGIILRYLFANPFEYVVHRTH